MSNMDDRFLSQAQCAALLAIASGVAARGGITGIGIDSTWTANVRWARNQIRSSGDVRNNDLTLIRNIHGAHASVEANQIDAVNVEAAVRRAEWIAQRLHENLENELWVKSLPHETPATPKIWSDVTYNLDASRRATAAQQLISPATAAKMMAAGYVQVSATGRGVMDTTGVSRYASETQAQYSVTVRDPDGTGSGWAGVDWNDWSRIDGEQLTAKAVDKCLRSRHPVAIEPGRYTTILEPQATADLFGSLFDPQSVGSIDPMDRVLTESRLFGPACPFYRAPGKSKIGEQILDNRITVSADNMDPDLGFLPFDRLGNVYHPAVWIEHGILKNLAYLRGYALTRLNKMTGLPNSGAFRMSGGTTSIEEMIATTKRGLLVTRLSNLRIVDSPSWLLTGFTRDGLWLIENGKISKAVKNFRFTESPLFVLNNVEQLGVPERVFHPKAPFVVPPIKVRDFSFTSLADAV